MYFSIFVLLLMDGVEYWVELIPDTKPGALAAVEKTKSG
jgi:hypothetical protein